MVCRPVHKKGKLVGDRQLTDLSVKMRFFYAFFKDDKNIYSVAPNIFGDIIIIILCFQGVTKQQL